MELEESFNAQTSTTKLSLYIVLGAWLCYDACSICVSAVPFVLNLELQHRNYLVQVKFQMNSQCLMSCVRWALAIHLYFNSAQTSSAMSFQQQWSSVYSTRQRHKRLSQLSLSMSNNSLDKIISTSASLRPSSNDLLFRNEAVQHTRSWLTNCVLMPDSLHKKIWDTLASLFILLQAACVPFSLSGSQSDMWGTFDTGMFVFFTMDMLVSFNTAYYELGALVTSRRLIFINYTRSWLALDFLSTFPVELAWCKEITCSGSFIIGNFEALRYAKLLKLLRIFKLKRTMQLIENSGQSKTLANWLMLSRIFLIMCLFFHWNACYLLMEYDFNKDSYPSTWVSFGLENASLSELYVEALYWSVVTIALVGYGDNTPKNLYEIIWCLVTMAISSVIFTYTISILTAYLTMQSAEENAHRSLSRALRKFMSKHSLPEKLQVKANSYIDYAWNKRQEQPFHEDELLLFVSTSLRQEIHLHTRGADLMEFKVFRERFSNVSMLLSEALQVQRFAPEDLIFQQGEITSKLYCIQEGKLDLLHKPSDSILRKLGPKDWFGEIAFFGNVPRTASAKCITFSEMIVLDRSDVDASLKAHPTACIHLEYLRDCIHSGDLSKIDIVCFLCDIAGHIATDCKTFSLGVSQLETSKLWFKYRSGTKHTRPIDKGKRRKINLGANYSIRNVSGEMIRSSDFLLREPNNIDLSTHRNTDSSSVAEFSRDAPRRFRSVLSETTTEYDLREETFGTENPIQISLRKGTCLDLAGAI